MKLATWNVNSLRARTDLVLDWLRVEEPDILCMQETKVTDEQFPTDELQRLGYSVAIAGQKSYNGVAIAARRLIRDVRVGLEGARPTDEKRLISGRVGSLHVFCCYVPNGKNVDSESFQQKLRWLEQLKETLERRVKPGEDVVVCGDFNIATDARDVYDPEAFAGKTHFHPEEHKRLAAIRELGFYDAFRLHSSQAEQYTWWDYRGAYFRRNQGLRIDYIFVSGSLKPRCRSVRIAFEERSKEKPSDHVPVVAEFGDR